MNNAFKGFLALLIIYIILLFVYPILNFQPWFKWWKTHQKEDKTQTCMPMTLFAYQNSSNILYDFASLFFTKENQMFEYNWQVEFVSTIMRTWAVDLTKDGFLTPYGMCTSIAPQSDEETFKYKPHVKSLGLYSGPDFIGWPSEIDVTKGTFKGQTLKSLWWGVLAFWGCYKSGTELHKDEKLWIHKSNFLWHQYGIPSSSLVCGAFVMDTPMDPSETTNWYPSAMPALLGLNNVSGAGGWIGFTKSGGSWGQMGVIGLQRQVWAELAESIPTPDPSVDKCGSSGFATAALSGLNTGAMAGFATASLSLANPIFAIIGGIVGLVAGGVLSAVQSKCI
jgi:hypothetical protein